MRNYLNLVKTVITCVLLASIAHAEDKENENLDKIQETPQKEVKLSPAVRKSKIKEGVAFLKLLFEANRQIYSLTEQNKPIAAFINSLTSEEKIEVDKEIEIRAKRQDPNNTEDLISSEDEKIIEAAELQEIFAENTIKLEKLEKEKEEVTKFLDTCSVDEKDEILGIVSPESLEKIKENRIRLLTGTSPNPHRNLRSLWNSACGCAHHYCNTCSEPLYSLCSCVAKMCCQDSLIVLCIPDDMITGTCFGSY